MKSWTKTDTGFLAVLSLFLGLSVLGLDTENTGSGAQGQGLPIGTITFKNQVAERKLIGQVLWDGLVQSGAVFNQDTIRTGNDSSATLHLKDKSELAMGEDSMILVDTTQERLKVAMVRGQLAISSHGSLTLETRSGEIEVDGGRLSLSATEDGVTVQTEEGRVQVSSGGTSVQAAPGTLVSLSGSLPPKTTPLEILAETPKQGAVLYTSSFSVNFRWKASSALRLLVAKDSKFQNIEEDSAVHGTEAFVSLPEGTHYWKLKIGEGQETPIRWFSLRRAQAPLLWAPLDQVFFHDETPPLVLFSWETVPQAAAYRLEISGGSSPFSKQTPLTSTSVEDLPDGNYRWKVSALFGEDSQVFSSQEGSFRIRKFLASSPPQLLTPEPGRQVDPAVRILGFSWSDPNQGGLYRFVLSSSPDLSTPAVQETVKTRTVDLTLPEGLAGPVYWKVDLLDSSGAPLLESARETFTLFHQALGAVRILSIGQRESD